MKNGIVHELRLALLRALISILALTAAAYLTSNMLPGIGLDNADIDKQSLSEAKALKAQLMRHRPKLKVSALSSHELAHISGLVVPQKTSTTFAAVGGHSQIKKDLLLHVVVALRNHTYFFSTPTLRPPSGVLLHGPPGTGKTMLVSAMATEAEVPMLKIKSSIVEQKYYGESVKMIRSAFSLAKKIAPCIMLFDEIDGIMRNRSQMDQGADYSVKTELLQQLDSLEPVDSPAVIVVAATNCPKKLDSALYRRLPRVYEVCLPDVEARKEILSNLLVHEPSASDGSSKAVLQWLSESTAGYSGSDLKDLYRSASLKRNEVVSNMFLKEGAINTRVDVPKILKKQWKEALRITTENIRLR